MTLRFRQAQLDLDLEIDSAVIGQIEEQARKHNPKEFGGILIGHYSDNRKKGIVTDTMIPSRFFGTTVYFRRYANGLNKKLRLLHDATDGRSYYIGEWHSHPNGPCHPSRKDETTLAEIAGNQKINVATPILLIYGFSRTTSEIGLYIHHQGAIHEYTKVV